MKRIILILIIILMPLNTNALNYKTTTNKKELTKNDVIVKQEKLYKYYKKEKIFSEEYFIENENNEQYPFISEDFIIKQSEEQEELPIEKPNRIIKETKYNVYNPLKKINRIVFSQINLGSYFYEIEIYEKEEKIDYIFSNHNETNYSILNDNDKEINSQKLTLKTIDIILSKKINPMDITIKVYLKKYFSNVSITIELYPEEITEKYEPNNHEKNNENSYIRINKKITFTNDDIIPYDFKVSEENILKYQYENEQLITKEELNDKLFYKTNEIVKYTYQDKLFKYYQIKRNYLEGYYSNKEDYLKDEENYIIKYTYYTKEKTKTNKLNNTKKVNKNSNKVTNTNFNNKKTQNKTVKNKDEINEKLQLNKIETNTKNKEEIKEEKQINMSKKEIIYTTKTNKIIYIIPVILLMLLSLLGYLLYQLLKE